MKTPELKAQIEASIATKQRLLDACLPDIERLCTAAEETVRSRGTLLFCGNGGSSCDASHAVGELVGWFEVKDREGYSAIALGHEVPTLTAIGNDAGYDEVFARHLRAVGRPGDLLIGISTSGGSRNVVRALEAAKECGIKTAALVSERGGPVAELADVAVCVPSDSTPRIQESHLLVVHLLCAWIESRCRAAS